MAAYAALVSLDNLMVTIRDHPRPPITVHQEQFHSLYENVGFLRRFLEIYPRRGCNVPERDLENQIIEAASAAEDSLESHIADRILAARTRSSKDDESADSDLYQDLAKPIEDMDLIKLQVLKIQETTAMQDYLKPEIPISSTILPKPATTRNFTMVGFDEALIEIMERLTEQQPTRQILPIIGMGGMGKTTLAKNVYDNLCIVHHFDIRIWVTISQHYSVRDIFLEALRCVGKTDADKISLLSTGKMSEQSVDGLDPEVNQRVNSQRNEDELGLELYKSLFGRRYLVVMDDMWSAEAWEDVELFFPKDDNGSRIVITTRLSDLAAYFGWCAFRINFLDKEKSWELLCKSIFAEECCPIELEETGKKIAMNCRGLPLSIVLVGGILANSEKTRGQWEYVAGNLRSILNLEDHEYCWNILSLSYNYLPVHLKPCFLYMGVFPEGHKIRVSMLIKLWVSEGFLKPIEGKSLEFVARSYLNDLIDRNLVLVNEWGCSGKVKFCHIHDLLRGLCLRECQKEKFIGVKGMLNFDIFNCTPSRSRVSVHESIRKERESLNKVLKDLPSALHLRSLLCDFNVVLPFCKLRLLRVFDSTDEGFYNEGYSPDDMSLLVNSRYLSFRVDWKNLVYPYNSIHHLWNLQTIIVKGTWIQPFVLPHEIWEMSQLRHLHIDRHFLPNPSNTPMQGVDPFVLKNLQRLSATVNFKFGEAVIRRIPNINKLHVIYDDLYEGWSNDWCLHNLHYLNKLESLVCVFPSLGNPFHHFELVRDLIFPPSLKKLSLSFSRLHWNDMTKIGSLPHLEVLKLEWESFCGPVWIPIEGEFHCLKFLQIQYCKDLVYWTADRTHFPRLEHLVLEGLYNLKGIPLDIGEIPTLRLMELIYCSNSAVISAKNILDEQENLGNAGLRVRVRLSTENECELAEVESLTSEHFEVQDRFGGKWVG
ncbi:putative late blight resistance protein homolog R1A-3 [Henckelia pumila]|uniref:putative late blight resistance protein homolog R1A-3 n=1 Tax=Henckelia pumila TaxID=405737 RepID=UPI003C6E22F5